MRTIICHYHIYKNSGTSFDTLLKINFDDKHVAFDGPFPFFTIDQEQLTRIIIRKPDIVAFSSHQIQLPVPVSLDFMVIPTVFVRHPILRVNSVYKFKRKHFDGTITSENAGKMTFDEWIMYCFTDRNEISQISNSQTRILGGAYQRKSLLRRKPYGMEYDCIQAMRNLRNVELLARTEFFNQDVKRFTPILKKHGISFTADKIVPQNVTSNHFNLPVDERVEEIMNTLSKKNQERLIGANQQDMLIYEQANAQLNNN